MNYSVEIKWDDYKKKFIATSPQYLDKYGIGITRISALQNLEGCISTGLRIEHAKSFKIDYSTIL